MSSLHLTPARWSGPGWVNERHAEELGFRFSGWLPLHDLLVTGYEENPLLLLLGYRVPSAFLRRVAPQGYLNGMMQYLFEEEFSSLGRHRYGEDYNPSALPLIVSRLGGYTRSRGFNSLDVLTALGFLGYSKTDLDPDAIDYPQLRYTLMFELRQSFRVSDHWAPHSDLELVLNTMHFRDENTKVVCWYDDPSLKLTESRWVQPDISTLKVKSARWPKFLQMLNRKFGFRFTDEDMQKFATWVGENIKVPKYSFRLVSGDNIPYYYNKEYFGSCMHENEATEFYAHQDNVEMLIIEDEHRRYVGRALVWHGNYVNGEPVTVMDRVYPSDGGHHIKAAMEYAKKQGWEYKVVHAIGGALSTDSRIKVTVRDVGYYPYMDTFTHASAPDGDEFILCNQSSYSRYPYSLDSTDNMCPWEDQYSCCYCGDGVPEDDVTWINGCVYCEYCRDENFVFSEIEHEWIERDMAVEPDNLQSVCVHVDHCYLEYSEYDDCHYWTGPGTVWNRVTPVERATYGAAKDSLLLNWVVVTMPDGDQHIIADDDRDALNELQKEGGEF